MKPSTRLAYLFIILFIVFFNGLQVYLIIERITESKTKFGTAVVNSMIASLFDYSKIKGIDSASKPRYAVITYASKKIEVTRPDTQTVKLTAPFSSLITDTLDKNFVERLFNNTVFKSTDLNLFEKLFQRSLRSKQINAAYRLDTIVIRDKKAEQQLLQIMWEKKRKKEYDFATNPMRIPFSQNCSVFTQVKYDNAFFKDDLLWPLSSFLLILLIGNTALVFVYRTIRRQKRMNELKNDFINNITHEMKTPITIASAGLQALEHHIPDADRTGFYLRTSKRQLKLLNDFVERILDSAVQDISDFSLKKERTDLHAVFGELVQSYSLLQGKPVSFQLTGEGPVFISVDRLHLETAFHNIIDNAIKYSDGSVAITIDIVENSRDCTIKIRDNGMGIQPQFIKNIFDKFFRVPQGDTQAIKGFGLGLYYVNSIVKKHGGSISVHSKWQSGTEFIITLPKDA